MADSQRAEDSASRNEDADAHIALTEDGKREAAESALVEAFDNPTDKWMGPVNDGVPMKSINELSEQSRRAPKSRKEKCLQLALNLAPDGIVMLHVRILMDKTVDDDLVELVFNHILNRGESVKKPILRQIFNDETHSCWRMMHGCYR